MRNFRCIPLHYIAKIEYWTHHVIIQIALTKAVSPLVLVIVWFLSSELGDRKFWIWQGLEPKYRDQP